MEKIKIHIHGAIISLLVLTATICYLIPHLPDYASIGAIILSGAAFFLLKHLVFIFPFFTLWLSDLLLNNSIKNLVTIKHLLFEKKVGSCLLIYW